MMLKNKKIIASISCIVLVAVGAFWLYQNVATDTLETASRIGSSSNTADAQNSKASINANEPSSSNIYEQQNFNINAFFKAKTAAEAMSLLPQLTGIDPQTRNEMTMELTNLCMMNTNKLEKNLNWLAQATNAYCLGFTPMDTATFNAQAKETKSQYISAALRETYKKEGPSVLNESIAALVATSNDPYERSEALLFAAQYNIPLKEIVTNPNRTSEIEIKNTLNLAAHITFCKDNRACDAYGVRSLMACDGFSQCARATPFLEQLQQSTSPQQYAAAQRLVLLLEGKAKK